MIPCTSLKLKSLYIGHMHIQKTCNLKWTLGGCNVLITSLGIELRVDREISILKVCLNSVHSKCNLFFMLTCASSTNQINLHRPLPWIEGLDYDLGNGMFNGP